MMLYKSKNLVLASLLIGFLSVSMNVVCAQSVKISNNRITIQDGVNDAVLSEIKKGIGTAKDLVFILQKINGNDDLAKICAAYPDMKELEIDGPKTLTSIAPVSKLKNLTRFRLNGGTVEDFTPLSALTGLTSLRISGNNFENGMMATDLKWLNKLTNLTMLSIGASTKKGNLVSFEGIPAMPRLTSISISGAVPKDLTPLLVLSGLKTLELQNCVIADLTPLTGLPKLEKLNLYGATVKTFAPLAGCPALKELCYYAVKGADYSSLGKLTKLEILEGGLTDLKEISWITSLTNLKKFMMFSEGVTHYTPLAKLKLEELRIWNMKVSAIDLGFLTGMTSMKRLTLEGLEGVTKINVLQNLTALTSLSIIKFNTKGGEAIPLDIIKKLPNLGDLTISSGVFTDAQLTGFAKPQIRITQRR